MLPDQSDLLDAAHAAVRFAELAYAQLQQPSEGIAARLEGARVTLIGVLAEIADQR